MANISEYLTQLQKLTQQNLDILSAINDSFYTKREHLQVEINGANYAIPSFISLENKINALQDNFENIIYAPKTGEASFNMDGNTRTIQVKGYTCTPNRLTINADDIPGFSVEQNDIFKDFLTPNPYIRIDLQAIPNDITQVNVRKVALKSDALKSVADVKLAGNGMHNIDWSEIYKILSIYKEDQDYIMYDTLRQLPIRQNIGSGTYTIKSIDNNTTDENLDEYYTLTFHEDLKYKLFDETIEKYLSVGDELVTYDDSAKMQITSVNTASRQMTIKILNGDYLNLVEDKDGNLASDMCKLKFFSPVDYDKDKYINIPLEEDRYICIFIAPLNSSTNIQAPWGGGIIIDTDQIRWTADGATKFKDYYEQNVRNVGDILYEVTSAMTSSIMKYSEDDFKKFTTYKPVINLNNLKVMRINTHLDSTETVKNIRNNYALKNEYNTRLKDVQQKITDKITEIANISYAGISNTKQLLEDQLAQYNKQKNELTENLQQTIIDIDHAVNNSTIPLENAKYHIRGYYDWFSDQDEVLKLFWNHIRGIKVQYRYRNSEVNTGTAVTMDDKFIFSDWNDMDSFLLNKVPVYESGYSFAYPQYGTENNKTQNNSGENEPSFNQIDIPITQGETVDIKLKIVWDFGMPFIETTSDWSSIVNIEFPEELVKSVELMDIVNDNIKDMEEMKFNNILTTNGVTDHISDKLKDQDVTYYHNASNIASGLFTEERRIKPLDEVIREMYNDIIQTKDIVNSTVNTELDCAVIYNDTSTKVLQNTENEVLLPAYNNTNESLSGDSDNRTYSIGAQIKISNNSSHTAYLYNMFPGLGTTTIQDLKYTKFDKNDYCLVDDNLGIGIGTPNHGENASGGIDVIFSDQTANQWITFRRNNPFNGRDYYAKYTKDVDIDIDNILTSEYNFICSGNDYNDIVKNFVNMGYYDEGMLLYPYVTNINNIKQQDSNIYSSIILSPGESLMIPIMIHYRFAEYNSGNNSLNKTLCFDLRTSLYKEPSNYIIKFVANKSNTLQNNIITNSQDNGLSGITTQYKSTIVE